MSVLKIKKVRDDAKIPFRATDGSAGMDLYACIDEAVEIMPHEIRVIPTGIAIELESADYVAYIYARSGLAIKNGIAPANCVGVIDSDYRGEVCVGLLNQTEKAFTVNPEERIAQMVISPVILPTIEVVDELSNTQRGAGGFGSTGKK
ncbi:MAG: dUTP diphosphatase [Ruminococcus sp.]|nr:dUTP diphosphatase [Ruminococcus sp.]